MNRTKWDLRWLGLAEHISAWSKDPSTKVGAVIVDKRNRLVSMGFNGFPQAMKDFQPHLDNREEKYSRVVHGEINALIFAERSVEGCTLYTWPFLTCDRCFVQMAQAGIKRVVAPQATEEQLTRWGPAFDKVRGYAREMNIEITEMPLEQIYKTL